MHRIVQMCNSVRNDMSSNMSSTHGMFFPCVGIKHGLVICNKKMILNIEGTFEYLFKCSQLGHHKC